MDSSIPRTTSSINFHSMIIKITNPQLTSTDNIFGAGSKGRSLLSVSTSPSLNRLYIVSPVT